jgi:biotin carboxyl carrier protein
MYTAEINDKTYEIEFSDQTCSKGKINGQNFELDVIEKGNSFHIISNYKSYNINVINLNESAKSVTLEIDRQIIQVKITDELDILLKSMGINEQKIKKNTDLKAPMPGLVSKIFVNIGDQINEGDNLLVLEAMKMENNLKAESSAVIKDILVKQGSSVEKNEILIRFE